MTEEERVILAGYAHEVIDNPAMNLIMEKMKANAIGKLNAVDLKDTEAVVLYTQALQVLNAIEKGLKMMLTDGKVADVELKRRLGKSVKI